VHDSTKSRHSVWFLGVHFECSRYHIVQWKLLVEVAMPWMVCLPEMVHGRQACLSPVACLVCRLSVVCRLFCRLSVCLSVSCLSV
jgi:hypothetical protein